MAEITVRLPDDPSNDIRFAADSFTVRIGEWKADRWHAILSEIEAY